MVDGEDKKKSTKTVTSAKVKTSASAKVKRSKPKKPVKKKSTRKPQSAKAIKARKRLLELIQGGATLPTAIAVVCSEFKYKSRDTAYKWLARYPEFAEEIEIAELSVMARLEKAELAAAEGGGLIEAHSCRERYADGSVKKVGQTKKFAPANAQGVQKALARRSARMRRIDKSQDRVKMLKEVPNPVPTFEDEDGNEIPYNISKVIFVTGPEEKEEKDG